jgi:hypothetical protein
LKQRPEGRLRKRAPAKDGYGLIQPELARKQLYKNAVDDAAPVNAPQATHLRNRRHSEKETVSGKTLIN